MTKNLDQILDFFSHNQVPILPCFGFVNGICACRKGASCPSPGKHPLMFHWQVIATCKKDIVKSWIGTGTKPVNLAIRTGMKNPTNGKYLVGVDLDLVDHPMKRRLGRHSQTLTQRSGSGGDHAFYWSKFPVRNSVQFIEDKLDIRGSGGIMVIAPSLHKSGSFYEFTCDLDRTVIQDLPDFLESKLRITIAKRNTEVSQKRSSPQTNSTPSQAMAFWGQRSISVIRNGLVNGEKVPLGARNATMHRLLSSDRAKGTPTTNKLLAKAKEYLPGFEDADSFEEELSSIVKSVMRYPAYNNSHEKVNELYLGWMAKNGYKSEHNLKILEEADQRFFGTLEPSLSIEDGVPLKFVVEKRAEFMRALGLTKFATYRPQLLAKKLISLGILRKRTAKSNNWLIKFNSRIPLTITTTSCNNSQIMGKLEMALAPEQLTDTSKSKELKDGDVIDHKGRKVKVELIKTQVKNTTHPREHLYQGKTGYDYNKALMGLMAKMSEEQMNLLLEKQLVMDNEATIGWVKQVQPNDVIGVVSHRYKVLGQHSDGHLVVDRVTHTRTPGVYKTMGAADDILVLGDLDHARELGLLEILWRDEKPFGIPETRDMTIVVLHDLEDPDNKSGKKKKTK